MPDARDCESCRHAEQREAAGQDAYGALVTVQWQVCAHPNLARDEGPRSAGIIRDSRCGGNWWQARKMVRKSNV